MLYLKSCPRCRGDVKYERDMYGQYLGCLQCGFLLSSRNDSVSTAVAPETAEAASKKSTKAA